MTENNWAGNIAYAAAVQSPRTLAELQAIVRSAPQVRALGSRHSFNRIADTGGALLSLKHLERRIDIDAAARTVTVDGGITYGQLCPVLDKAGFALRNLASLPHISVAGAVATATHGSGNSNQNLAAAVAGLEIVTANGEMLKLRRGDADFAGAVVGLGALGVVTALTLDLVPRFEVRQTVYADLPFGALLDNFDAVTGAAYSVSCFTRWRGDSIGHVWLKALADAPPRSGDLFGATPATRPWHPIPEIDPTPCTQQLGVPGPWYERLPHFRMDFTPSAGAELQSEYFVPRAHVAEALRALRQIQDTIAGPLMISEIRTIAADELWLSMCHGTDSVAFHFTWQPDWGVVQQVLPVIEAALRPFRVRPHWGKLFTMPAAELPSLYPRFADFRALLHRHDPDGKFRNAFVNEIGFG